MIIMVIIIINRLVSGQNHVHLYTEHCTASIPVLQLCTGSSIMVEGGGGGGGGQRLLGLIKTCILYEYTLQKATVLHVTFVLFGSVWQIQNFFDRIHHFKTTGSGSDFNTQKSKKIVL